MSAAHLKKRKLPLGVGHQAIPPSKKPKRSQDEKTTLMHLPTELFVETFKLLDTASLQNIRNVCSRFRTIADAEAVQWFHVEATTATWFDVDTLRAFRRQLRSVGVF
jgi:hypothetical protein